LLVGRDVDDVAGRDGEIGIVLGVTGADFRSLSIESDGNLASLLGLLGLPGIVDNALCTLRG